MTVAVLGTGRMGTALSRALARAGVPLVLGSRELARARAQVAQLRDELGAQSLTSSSATAETGAPDPRPRIVAADYRDAVANAEIVVLAVAYEHAQGLLAELGQRLAGRLVVDPTTPWGEQIPPTSGAVELARLLPRGTPLVAAWKSTFAGELSSVAAGEGRDVLLCGEDAGAKARVADLVTATGFRPLDCGGLEHAGTMEGMTRLMAAVLRNLGLPRGTVPAFHFSASAPADGA